MKRFLEKGRIYFNIVRDEIFAHSVLESNLIKGLGCSDSSVLIYLPKEQAATCFGHLFHNFKVCGSMEKGYRNFYVEQYLHFGEDVRFAYLDGKNVGPEVEDMIAFLSGCPELSHKIRTMAKFRLSCLCVERVDWLFPEVEFVSLSGIKDGPDLPELVKLVRSYLLSNCPDFFS